MIDQDLTYKGPVIGVCGKCLGPIFDGPGENTMQYSCICVPRNPLMYSPPESKPSKDAGKETQ